MCSSVFSHLTFPFIPFSLSHTQNTHTHKPLPKPSSHMNMFGHNMNNELPYDYSSSSSEYHPHFPLLIPETTAAAAFQSPPPPQLFLPPLDIPTSDNYDPVAALRSELGYTSSGCSSYGGSPTSCYGGGGGAYSPTTAILQRSISSHSLHNKNLEIYNNSPMHSSSSPRYFEPEIPGGSVRKAMSTGDLQVVNLGQQHNQRSNIGSSATESSIIESMNRANPYSPEEKKERIERYRSKRNLRNFNKKIKYECRKTLADSRPRIRGRFARNDEIEKIPQSQWDQNGIEEDNYDEDDDSWIRFIDAFSANLVP